MNTYNIELKDEDIVKQINTVRLSNKNSWYQINITNDDIVVCQLKCYNLWIQRSTIPVFDDVMIDKVSHFKTNIENGINELLKRVK